MTRLIVGRFLFGQTSRKFVLFSAPCLKRLAGSCPPDGRTANRITHRDTIMSVPHWRNSGSPHAECRTRICRALGNSSENGNNNVTSVDTSRGFVAPTLFVAIFLSAFYITKRLSKAATAKQRIAFLLFFFATGSRSKVPGYVTSEPAKGRPMCL